MLSFKYYKEDVWLFSKRVIALSHDFVWRVYMPVVVTSLQLFTPNELTSRWFRIEYYLAVIRRLRRSPAVFSLGLSPFPSRHSPWPGFHILSRVWRTLEPFLPTIRKTQSLPSGTSIPRLRTFFLLSVLGHSFTIYVATLPSFPWSFSFFRFSLGHVRRHRNPSVERWRAARYRGSGDPGRGCSHCLFPAPAYIPPYSSILLYPTSFPWLFPSTFILLVAPTPLV